MTTPLWRALVLHRRYARGWAPPPGRSTGRIWPLAHGGKHHRCLPPPGGRTVRCQAARVLTAVAISRQSSTGAPAGPYAGRPRRTSTSRSATGGRAPARRHPCLLNRVHPGTDSPRAPGSIRDQAHGADLIGALATFDLCDACAATTVLRGNVLATSRKRTERTSPKASVSTVSGNANDSFVTCP